MRGVDRKCWAGPEAVLGPIRCDAQSYLIYRRTGNLRAVTLARDTKIESTGQVPRHRGRRCLSNSEQVDV